MSIKRGFYERGEEHSSQGRSYGGGNEGIGRGGGYPSKGQMPEKKLKYKAGERIIQAQGFKSETGYGEKGPSRGTRTGAKAKSQRRGQRKHAA